ncbi:MAG: SET domain-containing protein-lysine N-methyltransferase, partial [Gemmatimonadaceae bacterium]
MSMKRVAEPQPFIIRESAIQGRGGFATRAIRKGERIAEYLGERISWKEADRRYDDTTMGRHHTFLFSLTSRTVIDAAVDGSDARFINHSCGPNCEAVDDRGHIYIEALQNISKGAELTYDYAYERDATHTDEDESLYACR